MRNSKMYFLRQRQTTLPFIWGDCPSAFPRSILKDKSHVRSWNPPLTTPRCAMCCHALWSNFGKVFETAITSNQRKASLQHVQALSVRVDKNQYYPTAMCCMCVCGPSIWRSVPRPHTHSELIETTVRIKTMRIRWHHLSIHSNPCPSILWIMKVLSVCLNTHTHIQNIEEKHMVQHEKASFFFYV